MGHDTPIGEPETLRPGDTWSWERTFHDHPHTDGWSVEYILGGASGPIILSASAKADTDATYEVEEAATEHTDVDAGTYRWIARATKDGETYTVDEGVFEVLENLADSVVGGQATHNERVLSRIRDALEGRIDKDQEEITIDGRSIRNIPMLDLRRLEAVYSYRVWQERNPGKPNPTRKVSFP